MQRIELRLEYFYLFIMIGKAISFAERITI